MEPSGPGLDSSVRGTDVLGAPLAPPRGLKKSRSKLDVEALLDLAEKRPHLLFKDA